jgi:hypothetical protein
MAQAPGPSFTTTYTGKGFLILIVKVNYNASYGDRMKKDLDDGVVESVPVDGIGDWAAYIDTPVGRSLDIGYRGIFLRVGLTGTKSGALGGERVDEIFKELARLACENYDALLI